MATGKLLPGLNLKTVNDDTNLFVLPHIDPKQHDNLDWARSGQ